MKIMTGRCIYGALVVICVNIFVSGCQFETEQAFYLPEEVHINELFDQSRFDLTLFESSREETNSNVKILVESIDDYLLNTGLELSK